MFAAVVVTGRARTSISISERTEQVASDNNASDIYLGGAQLEFRPGYLLS
jgi:hypothetical protein